MELTVERGDRQKEAGGRVPIILVLDNLRSAFNVGNIFRIAETAGIKEIITCGYTAHPPHPKLKKTARGCDELVKHRHFEKTIDAIFILKDEGNHITAVETCKNASLVWNADLVLPQAFILGNEALGISEEALSLCDSHVKIPVFGYKNSLNVANCTAVIVYDVIRRFFS
ncbi:MAG: TrmH family RNA methyltransferase [Verrucomicrobiota bacterium]|nr:TrmH family RNA methyltransferase [Verrucomicrobiota bacterium]